MMVQQAKKRAVLINAKNTQFSVLQAMMTELAKYGYIIVKRAYGDGASAMSKFITVIKRNLTKKTEYSVN